MNQSSAIPGSVTRPAYFLVLLTAGYAFNQIDRQILGILIEPIKAEFLLNDAQMGLLSGIFTLAYLVIGLPLAALADRHSRRNLLALCLGAWSGLTAMCGLAANFVQLLLLRLSVGAGESGGSPISLSIISDLYPPRKRASAIGIYGLGTNIGALVSLAIGGWIAATLGWRAAFFVVGLPGLALALILVFTTRDPVRGSSENREAAPSAASVVEVLKQLWINASLRKLLLALSAFAVPYGALLVWLPAFFVRSHGMPLAAVGLKLGLVIGVMGAVGSVSGGVIADRLRNSGLRYVPLYLGLTYFCCAPFAVMALMADGPSEALLFLAGWTIAASLGTGAQFAMIQGLVGMRMRARAMAAIGIVMNIGAFYVGPQLVGLCSDLLTASAGTDSLRYALLLICSFYVLALLFAAMMASTVRKDTDKALLLP